MKTIEMLKDWEFWKWLIIFELIGILTMLFIVSPLISVWGYNHNSFMQKNNLVNGYYYPSSDKIVLFNNSTITLRHELTHRQQKYKNETNIYLNEFEAYIFQWFFWNKVNLTTMDWEK